MRKDFSILSSLLFKLPSGYSEFLIATLKPKNFPKQIATELLWNDNQAIIMPRG